MKILSVVLVLSSFALAETDRELQAQLAKLAKKHAGKVALFAKDLKTGKTVTLQADEVVQTASTIKLAAYLEAFEQIKAGKKALGDKVTLRAEDKVPGSGVLQYLRPPLDISLEDALVLMMIESDNTATNLVIDQLGLQAINERIAALGLKDTYFYKKVYRPAEGPQPPDQRKYGLGKTTPREMARMMEWVVGCEIKDEELCKKMVEIMKGQQYRNMIPRYIEPELDASEGGTKIIDKTGSLDAVRNDVGAILARRGPIVISIFTYQNKDQSWTSDNAGEQLIGRLAKTIYDAWAKGE